MKKVLSIILAFVIMISTFSTTVYAEETDYGKFTENIEETNQKIDLQIEKAIDEADNLIIKYEDALLKNMDYMNTQDFEYYLETVKDTLNMISDPNSQSDKVTKKLSNLYEKIDIIQNEISSRENIDDQLIIKDEKALDEAQKLTAGFQEDLNRIIANLVNTTNEMVQKLIEDGKKEGIEIESLWVEVKIGGRIILVDPCRTRSL